MLLAWQRHSVNLASSSEKKHNPGGANVKLMVALTLHEHVTWQKLSQYSVEDATETDCCLRTSSKALSVARRVSIAIKVSSAESRAQSLHSCSASTLFSAIFVLRHGAYAVQSGDAFSAARNFQRQHINWLRNKKLRGWVHQNTNIFVII